MSTMTNAAGTAIIGCGPRAQGHAQAAAESGALQIRYACDIDRERAEAAATAWGATPLTDYGAALDDPAVEAVIVVTDVGSHLAIAEAALAAGKQLIVEKPLGDDIPRARALIERAEASKQVVYVSFQLRFHPRMMALREAASRIDPVQVFFGRSRGMMKPQFLNPSPFGGIMDFLAHDFDLVSWFMGRAPVAVSAVIRRDTFTRDTGAADVLSALIDYGDGRSATVVSSIGAREVGTKCDLTGARGNASLRTGGELSGVRFSAYDSNGAKTPLDLTHEGGANADVALQQAFLREIREGAPSQAAGLQDGLNSLLLTLASLRSAEEGRRVPLAEMDG